MAGLKDDLCKVAARLALSQDDFGAVGIYAWPAIMRQIEAAFVIKTGLNTSFSWWWESLKHPQVHLQANQGHAVDYLPTLVAAHEPVWYVTTRALDYDVEEEQDPTKLWLFQGRMQAVHQVITASHPAEYYLVSKKYTWLLCGKRQDQLLGVGSILPKMQALATSV
jgi:hypothetical protein